MKSMRYLTVTTLLFLTTGCSVYSLIPPGENKLGEITVDHTESWSQRKIGSEITWTRDGALLNLVSLSKTSSGKHILRQKLTDATKAFEYRSGMEPEEIMELFLDAITISGAINVELERQELVLVDENPAIRFQYAFDNEEGLNYRVLALLIKRSDDLYQLICRAPSEYYFPIFKEEFERILDSARFN